MDASSAMDPPDLDSVEMRPLVRGSDAPEHGRVGGGSVRAPRAVKTVTTGARSGIPPATVIDTQLSSPLQRKKGLVLLLSTMCVALLLMVVIKRGAVGIEKNIEVGEQEAAVHLDLDHHHSDGFVSTHTEPSVVDTNPSGKEKDGAIEAKKESEMNADEPKTSTKETTSPEKVIESSPKSQSKTHIVINHQGYQPTEMLLPTYYLPGTEEAPRGSAAGGGWEFPLTNHFQFRNPDLPTSSTWGYFDFEDPNEEWRGKVRPIPDFGSFPNRDVFAADFPKGSWQTDDEYMKQFLTEAKLLVNRTMEAVFAEYGVGAPGGDISKLSSELQQLREKFAPYTIIENIDDEGEYTSRGENMWTSKQSLDGLARRIIHAIITQDTFHLTLGGHSAAAGHGNNFNQSYIIQAGRVLEPVFAHLGVTFRARNFAQGGMGTLQQALAGMDLRGKDTDVLMWDSSMTEKDHRFFTFFVKQAMISGNRAPYIIGSGYDMREFHRVASVDIGEHGSGWDGPVTESETQALELPFAARFLTCVRDRADICKKHEYEGNGCWVDRDDYTPPQTQNERPGGQASWHPGNRIHQIRGRRIALLLLRGLEYALEKWDDLTSETGHPLAEEHWHVTEYYNSIKEKAPLIPGCIDLNTHKIGQKRQRDRRRLRSRNESERFLDDEAYWPWRICDLPLQGRSLWAPREYSVETSLVSILKANPMGDLDPNTNNAYMWPPVYYPPELIGPWYFPPEDEVNVEQIANARRLNLIQGDLTRNLAADEDSIVPGYGFDVRWGMPGICDGTSHNWCDKSEESKCLMGGTQDNRGMICFNGLSGWVVFEIKNVKHGFIGARMEAWHYSNENKLTTGWTEVNNGGKGNYEKRGLERKLSEQKLHALEQIERMKSDIEKDVLQDPDRRRLGGGQSCGFVDDYVFEWAIDGKVVTWDKNQFCEQYTRLTYNLDAILFMDDESKTGDIELAMRIKNTGSDEEMCISHLWWA